MNEIKERIQAALEKAGLPYEEIKVFGAIRCNVHIKCLSYNTAKKWAHIINSSFKGAKVSVIETSWEAKQNKGTSMLPTMKKGFLVAVAA